MKKNIKIFFITFVIFIVALFSLTGCKNNDNNNDNNEVIQNSNNLSRGSWSGDVYTNEFTNTTFNLPENWAIASDEDIAYLMDIDIEALTDDQKDLTMLAAKSGLYCFVVNNPSTGSNVITLIEKPGLTLTTDYYISNLKKQLTSLEDVTYTLSDPYEKDIANNSYAALDATIEGVDLNQHYFIRNIDKYFFSIIITTAADDDVNEILNCFE